MDENTRTLSPRLVGLWFTGILVWSMTLLSNGLHGEFVFDDRAIVAANPLIQKIERLPALLAAPYWGSDIGLPQPIKGTLYRPVTLFTYFLNYQMGGAEPLGFKVVNWLLHAAVTAMVFLLMRRLGADPSASLIAMAAFACIPVHTEAVVNVVGRAELLAALGVLSGWILLFNQTKTGRVAGGLACYAFALGSKETGLLLLPALVVSELWRGPAWRSVVRDRWPVWSSLAIVAALFLFWKKAILGEALSTGGADYFDGTGFFIRLLTIGSFFVLKTLPALLGAHPMCADYSRPAFPDASAHDLAAWAGVLAGGILIWGSVWLCWRRRNLAGLSLLLFILFWLPTSNLFVPIQVIGAERFLYLPSMALCLGLGAGFAGLGRRQVLAGRLVMGCVLGSMLAFWSWRTVQQNAIWRSDRTLWEANVRCSPRSPRAWNGLGIVHSRAGQYSVAQAHFERALNLDPQFLYARFNLAETFVYQGDFARAEPLLQAVIEQAPWDKEAWFYLGLIAEKRRQPDKAFTCYSRSISIDPYYAVARRNRALILCRQGARAACVRELQLYLAIAPADEDTRDIAPYLQSLQ